MIRISAPVPVWNEERRLAASLEILLHHFSDQEKDGSEIVICADGCTDGTLNVAKEYAEKFPQIKIADWPERLGKGGGILNGLRFAGVDITVITDVDLSAPLEQLPKLVSQVASGKADLIIGSRTWPSPSSQRSPRYIERCSEKASIYFSDCSSPRTFTTLNVVSK